VATDYTTNIEPALRLLLRGGESLLVASPMTRDPGTTEDVSITDELKNLLDPTILLGLGAHPGELLQRATFGRALIGGPESMAGVLFDVVRPGNAPALAVTDRRLLIYRTEVVEQPTSGFWQRWFGPAELVAHPLHEVDRTYVAGAVAAPAGLLRRGRILVAFTDGSVCALVCALPKLGARAAAAIGPPQLRTNRAEGEEPG
jgi:hypothetical protein